MGKSKKADDKRRKNNRKPNGQHNNNNPSVVGPDLFLLLQGRLFEKNVALILCGETHNDAIEVTRKTPPGQFDPIDGWITLHSDVHIALPDILFISNQQLQTSVSHTTLSSPRLDQIAFRVLTQVNRNKSVNLARAKELATTYVEQFVIEEDNMVGRHLVLLWISSASPKTNSSRVEKGRAFLLEIKTEEEYNENNDDDDDDDVVGNMTNNAATLSFNDDNYTNRRKENDNKDDSNDDSSDDDTNDWVFFPSNYEEESSTQQINRSQLPRIVSEWMYDVMATEPYNNNHDIHETVATVEDVVVNEDIIAHNNNNNSSNNNNNARGRTSIGSYALFEWGDLDLIVHNLNKRRLGMTDNEVTEKEYDNIIQERKRNLKEEHNVSTFDDWFDHVRGNEEEEKDEKGDNKEISAASASPTSTSIRHAVHLVLESSVPPWEVELYRPNITTTAAAEDFRLHHAAECIRCLSEDSEESSEEEDNPSNDGIGSYMDFIYRRMMAAAMIDDDIKRNTNLSITTNEANVDNDYNDEKNGRRNDYNKSNWLHCIDARDLGCEAACHAEAVREKWNDLLTQEERMGLSNPNKAKNDACPVNKKGDSMRFLPAKKLNPECIELEKLRSKGLLVRNEYEDGDENGDEDEDEFTGLEFTFPSFELFFGQNTDNMYYSHHVKLAFSPFLANCVQSLDNFETFFITLFFGGTVPDALDCLNIRETSNRGHMHVRSPLLKRWDPKTKSYVWEERDDGEEYITCPFFPFAFHLVARDSFPPRTLSSQLYANLFDFCGSEGKDGESRRKVALAIKNWTLDSIRRNMDDPKASDDKETGGEWFAAFLHANHRDIYDDIDISDATVLLQKNYMKSISGGRPPKHNIGKIKIPSAKDSFNEILSRFREQDRLPPTTKIITARVEILAKIIIDIWTSNLFDFSLLLKIANICSNETKDNVVVVCYVGSAHAKAANKFFCNSLGFRKKAMIGKFTWEDYELKTLDLPSKLWNLSELFR